MDSTRFDRLATRLAARLTRRSALAGGGGLGSHSRAAAQEATAATSATPGADDSTAVADFLFVQVASSATWAPKPGADGIFVLTLAHQDGQTIFFSDRPERIVGSAPTQTVLDGLGFTPADPPNAAIVAGEEVLVVELINPVYDATSGTLTYDAALLDPGDASSGIQHLAQQQTDQELPQDLGPTSLFIDSAQEECDPFAQCLIVTEHETSRSSCGQYGGGPYYLCAIGPIPNGPIDSCWDSTSATCQPCDSTVTYDSMAASCNNAYSQCAKDSAYGTCYVSVGW